MVSLCRATQVLQLSSLPHAHEQQLFVPQSECFSFDNLSGSLKFVRCSSEAILECDCERKINATPESSETVLVSCSCAQARPSKLAYVVIDNKLRKWWPRLKRGSLLRNSVLQSRLTAGENFSVSTSWGVMTWCEISGAMTSSSCEEIGGDHSHSPVTRG